MDESAPGYVIGQPSDCTANEVEATAVDGRVSQEGEMTKLVAEYCELRCELVGLQADRFTIFKRLNARRDRALLG